MPRSWSRRRPDEDDREVSLTVVEPKKIPAAVGGGAEAAAGDEDATIDEPSGALDQPSVEEPADD